MPHNDPFESNRSLFVLTDPDLPSGEAIDRALAATRGGATHIVVRRPNDTAEGVARMANELSPARRNGDWKLLVHGLIDVALATQAQGAMLRLGGIPSGAKERLGEDRMMGVSVHTLGQAQSAHLKMADFVIFGNVYETESHPGKPGVGLQAIASVARDTDLPVVAIGGITAERVDEVLSTGASGVAVIRAVSRADDPEAATRRIREAIDAADYPHLTQGEIMTLTVNNEVLQIDRETLTIETFLRERGIPAASIVIAVNDDVVPRSEWEARALRDGDTVDIVQAVSGGDHDDTLTIARQAFSSRLFLGTGKYPDNDTMARALDASGY